MNWFADWTEEDVKKFNSKAKNVGDIAEKLVKPPKKRIVAKDKTNKYHNKHVTVDSINFDSRKEVDYYSELKMRLKAGEIKGFCRQAEFILAPNLRYKADFIVFNNDGTAEIIDVKGFKTQVYKDKKKVFEDKFNLKIKEV